MQDSPYEDDSPGGKFCGDLCCVHLEIHYVLGNALLIFRTALKVLISLFLCLIGSDAGSRKHDLPHTQLNNKKPKEE